MDNHTVDGRPRAHGLSPAPDASADGPLELRVQRGGGLSTVRVAGEVDLGTAARLRTVLADELAAEPSTLVIDLDQVSLAVFPSYAEAIAGVPTADPRTPPLRRN